MKKYFMLLTLFILLPVFIFTFCDKLPFNEEEEKQSGEEKKKFEEEEIQSGLEGWEVQESEIPGRIECCYFIDENTGWIGGYNTFYGEWLHYWGETYLYYTSDGGLTWTKQYNLKYEDTPMLALPCIYSIFFIDKNYGWAIGSNIALRTMNGGVDWDNIESIHSYIEPKPIYFIDENTGWTGGAGRIQKTTDGGINWVIKLESNYDDTLYGHIVISSIYFINQGIGWAVGSSEKQIGNYPEIKLKTTGIIFKTTDGGDTWESIPNLQNQISSWSSVYFYNENIGWILGDKGEDSTGSGIFKNTDGGKSWNLQYIGENNYDNMCFIDQNFGWIISDWNRILLKTIDGGENWILKSSKVSEYFEDLHFINENVGWIVGWITSREWEKSRIYKTTTGG